MCSWVNTVKTAMPQNINREKTLNAILFFAKETRHLNITKLCKLLNFFDFDHFKETGYPAIGLEYETFELGPVPRKLWLQLKDGQVPDDLKGKLAIVVKTDDLRPGHKEIQFKPMSGAKLDLAVFSPRQKRILERLAEIYKDARASDMTEVSHLPGQPWATTMATKGLHAPIDYLLALDSKSLVSQEEAKENLREHFEMVRAFDIEPVK